MTGRGNNTYLFAGAAGSAALIDTGVGETRHLAAVALALAGRGARLDDVLVTHAHADHISGAPLLARTHPHARFHKYPAPDEDRKYAVAWAPLSDGERQLVGGEMLTVLHTPGHAPDHVSLWHEASGTVFTGDLVVRGGSVMIESSKGGDLRQYLASLERILALGPRRLLPAHGPEIRDPPDVLNHYLTHRRLREQQVLEALGAGRSTVQAIAESIYDGLSPALLPAAKENVRAHLKKLEAEGRAFQADGRWTA